MSNIYETQIGVVVSSSASDIIIRVLTAEVFNQHKQQVQVGKYLQISTALPLIIVVTIQKIKEVFETIDGKSTKSYLIETQPVGAIKNDGVFERGHAASPIPSDTVHLLSKTMMSKMFSPSARFNFPFGHLSQNIDIKLNLDANNFFGKHIAVVGSTGSGKSCTVARILQQVIGIEDGKYIHKDTQKNAHIVIFDLHAEYEAAFDLEDDNNMDVNVLNEQNLILPYWLMNADELETMFIESKDVNVHNQKSQFRNAVILNKEKHNPNVEDVTYDTPVYFDIMEVRNYLENLNNEVIGKLEWENKPKLEDGTLVLKRSIYFDELQIFCHTSNDSSSKAVKGPFNGEFDKFLLNLDTKLNDKRLRFLFNPDEKRKYTSKDFKRIMRQFLGYNNNSNITIVDLSGIPFEVLTITVSLVSRLIFDFCFHLSKLQHMRERLNNVPVLLVCEEAHNYAPRNDDERYWASKKSLEKVVKEGRKYGLSLMVVSQRPSEVSETIFAQCNNFIALRLTNLNDQEYMKNLITDVSRSVADGLPNLVPGEFLVTGEAVLMPCIAKIPMPNPEPQSASVKFFDEWSEEWREIDFDNVIKRWRKEQVKFNPNNPDSEEDNIPGSSLRDFFSS